MKMFYCSSGKRYGEDEIPRQRKRKVPMSKKQRDFIRQCPAYGLTPDFYGALCLDANGEEYFLDGFAGEYCELSGGMVNLFRDFGNVREMLLTACEQELAELPAMASLLLGGNDIADRKAISDSRKDINARKRCVLTAAKYANPDMPRIFRKMGLPPFPGVKHYGAVYEFVSYLPDDGYVLENLGKNRYDPTRYTVVPFDVLRAGLMAFADELDPVDVTQWLQIVQNVKPAELLEEESMAGQLFFAF